MNRFPDHHSADRDGWVVRGRRLAQSKSALQFQLGDLVIDVLAGRSRGHGEVTEAIELLARRIGISANTLRDYYQVAMQWPETKRRSDVCWTVHSILSHHPDRFEMIKAPPVDPRTGERRWTCDAANRALGRQTRHTESSKTLRGPAAHFRPRRQAEREEGVAPERDAYIGLVREADLPFVVQAVLYELVLLAAFDEPEEGITVACVDEDVAEAVGLGIEALHCCLSIAEEAGYLRNLGWDLDIDACWFELRNPHQDLVGMWEWFLAEHPEPVRSWSRLEAKLDALFTDGTHGA
ncbi:DUF6192 family protein [Streptomyces sp. Je 1-4]|uniref:DUF6192 family protein n=1 Tax=Streptomyces TaxID=1883 RepID=UPI0021D809AA|nr:MULTISPECIES: DUF6192 family protein [unclassified Streptomyces]UYB40949.1 DUF6192 family protein [Streptomyces sp. Je 1-4]UZQ37109.1 DUF6192 family protein [Streptomyces sp. Je 1-4] [Streptomyces sp. Je 1-4 4N24]UZQ44526.1 DUF6192 family protein [Streptomyces sp. Je 1-4] [Streptomyces sp. Je 1-4 4N24_ara]